MICRPLWKRLQKDQRDNKKYCTVGRFHTLLQLWNASTTSWPRLISTRTPTALGASVATPCDRVTSVSWPTWKDSSASTRSNCSWQNHRLTSFSGVPNHIFSSSRYSPLNNAGMYIMCHTLVGMCRIKDWLHNCCPGTFSSACPQSTCTETYYCLDGCALRRDKTWNIQV